MESLKRIRIPVVADQVLSPVVYYADELTGIYFETDDEQFGRITFNNLDSIKICRGEMMPYEYNWANHEQGVWIFKVENSKWVKERFEYENENYGSSYEFGGNVKEMLTDFSHYLFSFHDQFVEVIARGFWFEKDVNSLFNTELKDGHPFLPLPETIVNTFEFAGVNYKAIFNPISIEELILNTNYCQQVLIEFSDEFEGKYSVSHRLIIMQREGKLISVLRGFFGKTEFEKPGVAVLEDVKPLIEKYIKEVVDRRNNRKKG